MYTTSSIFTDRYSPPPSMIRNPGSHAVHNTGMNTNFLSDVPHISKGHHTAGPSGTFHFEQIGQSTTVVPTFFSHSFSQCSPYGPSADCKPTRIRATTADPVPSSYCDTVTG